MSRRFTESTLRDAESALCDLEDMAGSLDREASLRQFRAAKEAVRHYRDCVGCDGE